MDGWMRKEGRNKFNYVLLGFVVVFVRGGGRWIWI